MNSAAVGATKAVVPASEETAIHVVRKGDLRGPRAHDAWDDPDGIITLTAEKREALLENPLSTNDTDPVQLVGTRGRRAVGRLDLLRGEALVEGLPVPLLWTSALSVEPAFRRSLLGVSMILRMQRLSPTVMTCGVSQLALPIFQKLKWTDFELPRWIRIRRSRPVVDRYVSSRLARAACAPLLDLGLAAHGVVLRALARVHARGLTARRALEVPDGLDPLLATPGERASLHRSVAWIRWLLRSSFDSDPRTRRELHLVTDEAGRTVAYFFLKVRFFAEASSRGFKDVLLGSVHDYRVFDEKRVSAADVLLLASSALDALSVDAVEICTDDAQGKRLLPRLGFVRVGALHLLFKAAKGSPLDRDDLRDQRQWRLRPAEGDNTFA